MHPYGGRVAFRFSAIMTFIAAVLYGLYLCIKKKYFNQEYHIIPTGEDSPPASKGEDNPGAYTNLSFMMESDGESEDNHTVKVKEEKKEIIIFTAAKSSLFSRCVKID